MSGAGERLGVLGGTFDPPHVGHLVAALEVRHALDLDRVLLVVANDPWQKTAWGPVSPAADRLAMVEAAVEGIPGLEASDIEIRRGGPSYMVDTLSELATLAPGAELFLIVGSDVAAGLSTWDRAEELPGLARLVLVDRVGVAGESPPPEWPASRVPVTRLDVSSSGLRERLKAGAPVELLIPPGVVELIERRGIYR